MLAGRLTVGEDVEDGLRYAFERWDGKGFPGGYDGELLKKRRHGRPPIGSRPADLVPVRIDPKLQAAIEARANAEHATISEIIREALRRFLEVA